MKMVIPYKALAPWGGCGNPVSLTCCSSPCPAGTTPKSSRNGADLQPEMSQMELVIDWGIVAQLLIAALIAMAWSFLMASKVAPRFVTRVLMQHLNNLDDPDDEIAGAMRRGAGLVMG